MQRAEKRSSLVFTGEVVRDSEPEGAIISPAPASRRF